MDDSVDTPSDERLNDIQQEERENSGPRTRVLRTALGTITLRIPRAPVRFALANTSRVSSESEPEVPTFDNTITARHEYLGADLEEIRGMTLHDEGSIVSLPILFEAGVVLVPGQTFPLTVFSPHVISTLRKVILKDKTFGVVCVRNSPNQKKGSAKFGTVAEIFQYQEADGLAGFRIKAKGRQRFKISEQDYSSSGILTGKVLILPEVSLLNPLHAGRFTSLDKYRHSSSRKMSAWDAAVTPWPKWVYRQYDANHLAAKVLEELKCYKLDSNSPLPTDPTDLSFWVVRCLPFDDIHRVAMLSLNTAIERLQHALVLLQKCQKVYCSFCGLEVADRKDICSMSADGPQGAYCNPDGQLHEVLTLKKALSANLGLQEPTGEYSWFPGYGWTMASCVICESTLGWVFSAMRSDLKPVKFWGLSSRFVTTHKGELDSEFDHEMYIYNRAF